MFCGAAAVTESALGRMPRSLLAMTRIESIKKNTFSKHCYPIRQRHVWTAALSVDAFGAIECRGQFHAEIKQAHKRVNFARRGTSG
jgi:hypothetical protein